MHTNRSDDSSGTIDEAAAAAGRAGLQFIVATDHGDGTRAPLPPSYRAGILWIDGVEISTTDGHYATFGMAQSPYPLAGDARDVADDVRRLGGTGLAAHGDSQKSEAQWRDWSAPIDGLEWLNLDSAWREAGVLRLARAALTFWFRPSATLASLAARPQGTLAHLDALAEARHTIALAATDAHGRTLPSYAACFGTFSTRVELDTALSGNASVDAAAVIAALRAGHHYTAVDALARDAGFEFTARSGALVAGEGDTLPEATSVTFDIHVEGPPGAKTSLLRNGVVVQQSTSPSWTHETDGRRAEYRVEVTLPSSPGAPPLPWIVSNPIFIGVPAHAEPSDPSSSLQPVGLGAPLTWQAEKDQTSVATIERNGAGTSMRFQLGGGAPANQFAAAVAAASPSLARARGVSFTVHASRPLRFSLELRAHGDTRWARSIYADETTREVRVAFDDMRPVKPNTGLHPVPDDVEALMLLVGVSNTAPGTQGELTFADVSLLK